MTQKIKLWIRIHFLKASFKFVQVFLRCISSNTPSTISKCLFSWKLEDFSQPLEGTCPLWPCLLVYLGPSLSDTSVCAGPQVSRVKTSHQNSPHSQPFIRFELQRLPFSPFIVPQCCQNTINGTLRKPGAIVHTVFFYCPAINRNCEKQSHEQISRISLHTHLNSKCSWTQGTGGSFHPG